LFPSSAGTTTVVVFGGGGLLLLMQADSRGENAQSNEQCLHGQILMQLNVEAIFPERRSPIL
jgi:hypothetical protein